MDTPEWELLSERIAGLERENRWLKRIGAAAVLGLMAMIAVGTNGFRSPRELAAQKIVLTDGNGRPRAKLEMHLDGPALRFLTPAGDDQLLLSSGGDGMSQLNYMDRGDLQMSLSTRSFQGSSLDLFDNRNMGFAHLFVGADGASGLALRRHRWGVGLDLDADANSKLRFYDREGEDLAGMAVSPEGISSVVGKSGQSALNLSQPGESLDPAPIAAPRPGRRDRPVGGGPARTSVPVRSYGSY